MISVQVPEHKVEAPVRHALPSLEDRDDLLARVVFDMKFDFRLELRLSSLRFQAARDGHGQQLAHTQRRPIGKKFHGITCEGVQRRRGMTCERPAPCVEIY